MDAKTFDKSRLPSRQGTEGAARAPPPPHYYATGRARAQRPPPPPGGAAMGRGGMNPSLPSREVIADSVELTMRGHCYDALVGVAGCDKSLPGMMMAMCRLNVPSVFIYGGSVLPGAFKGRDVTVVDVFEAVGLHSVGKM